MAERSIAMLIERAQSAKRESKYVEFKERFDPASASEWCELIKDFAAMANVGGGLIVVGLRNNGTPSRANVDAVLALDPAEITDKLFKYTGGHYGGFALHEQRRGKARLAVVAVEGVPVPMIFTNPGTYLVDADTGKQKTAFGRGTLYVRHGAKSEPGTSEDLRALIERRLDVMRKEWLKNVRKVVEAPPDAQVAIYRATAPGLPDEPARIQITSDPDAPVYGRLSIDVTHPYRQKELIAEVNAKLGGTVSINSRDVLSVRRLENIDEKSSPQFCARQKYASSPQYSDAFVEWLLDRYSRDHGFFEQQRRRYSERMQMR